MAETGGVSVAEHPAEEKIAKESTKKILKKVAKPDEAACKAKVDEINGDIKKLQDQISEIRVQIDEASNQRNGQQGVLNEARALMQALKTEQQQVRSEMQAMMNARNAAQEVANKQLAQNRTMRAELKFTTVEEIDAAIIRLERQQNTTSMSLTEEKKLLKEIEALKQSKKMVAKFSEQISVVETSKASADSFNSGINDKQAALKAINEKINAQWQLLKDMGNNSDEMKSTVPALIERRNALRTQIDEKFEQIRQLRADLKAANDEYFNYTREQKRIKAEKKKAEYDARQSEIEARKKAVEAEEAAKIPYEEEMSLCDCLVKYLEDSFLEKEDVKVSAPSASAECAALETDGLVLRALRRDDDDTPFLGGGKKKKEKNKKDVKKKKNDAITHTLDTLESFALLSLDPPVLKSDVPAAINAVKEKKKWYSEQPRGSVPRAAGSDLEETKPVVGKKKKESVSQDFNAMEEELFPSLPGAKPVLQVPQSPEGATAAEIALAPAPERIISPPVPPTPDVPVEDLESENGEIEQETKETLPDDLEDDDSPDPKNGVADDEKEEEGEEEDADDDEEEA